MSTTTRTLSPDDVQTLFRLFGATTLGGRVATLRAFHGWSYRTLSQRTGISTSVLYTLENGGHTYGPRMETVERIADAFGLSAYELIGER
jgi:transcriptional regulator with XRE-family HTH domain